MNEPLTTDASYHGVSIPDKDRGTLAGYNSLYNNYQLPIPPPFPLSIISPKNRSHQTADYKVYPIRYLPKNDLAAQLTFAIRYEGINLLVLKKLFEAVDAAEIMAIINQNPSGQYARKIWYLYEWLMDDQLKVPNAEKKINYTLLANHKIQYVLKTGDKSERHRITNNLLGTREFCPHVYKTTRLAEYENLNLELAENQFPTRISKALLQRASSYLLLKDSQSSYAIEGEHPKPSRLNRWGKAVAQAGQQTLTREEIVRLQQLVLPSKTKVKQGYRDGEGFIGDFDRETANPIPEHLSARWKDLEGLMSGLLSTSKKLKTSEVDTIVAAAIISFGFVFIHPLFDGNGRIHRYLIHHVLAMKNFAPQGVIFPVSASILDNLGDYKKALEKYSQPLLDFIDWETTPQKKIKITNETVDYYRYFDATHLAQYLYACVTDTITHKIPEEISLLQQYDAFKDRVEEELGLADNDTKLLWTLLLQNEGTISKKKRTKFFSSLSDEEVDRLETIYSETGEE